MRTIHQIIVLVSIQIVLIGVSFAFLAYEESQTTLTGNQINAAGKNRVLANTIQLELNRVLFHGSTVHSNVYVAIDTMENNILILKTGGFVNDVEIPTLSPEFDLEYDQMYDIFLAYKLMVYGLLDPTSVLNIENVERADITNKVLVAVSDSLAENLGRHSESISTQHILLQMLLGLLNIVILVLLVFLMWRIITRHTASLVSNEKFETIGKFASMMAHDIRNPLGTLRNSVEIIQRSNLPPALDNEVARINRSIWRISHQVEGVLNYVRTTPLVVSPEHVTDILYRSVSTVLIPSHIALLLPEANSRKNGAIAEDAGATDDYDLIECDSEKIEFVFVNLFINAMQAIGKNTGYITVRIRTGGMHDDNTHNNDNGTIATNGDDYVIIEFENSGFIPVEDVHHVFEPLFTTKMQGTGLGLTSCKNIVDMHSGSISVKNTQDSVVFTVRIPKAHMSTGEQSQQKQQKKKRMNL